MILGVLRRKGTLCFFFSLLFLARVVSFSLEASSYQETQIESVVNDIDAFVNSESCLEQIFVDGNPEFFIVQKKRLEDFNSHDLLPEIQAAISVLGKKLDVVSRLVRDGVRDQNEIAVLLMIIIKPYFEIGMGDEWVQPYFDAFFELNGVIQFIKQYAYQKTLQNSLFKQSDSCLDYYEQLFTSSDGLAFLLDKERNEREFFLEDLLSNNSLLHDPSDKRAQSAFIDFSENVKGPYQKTLYELVRSRNTLLIAVEMFQKKISQLMECGTLQQSATLKKNLESSFLAQACFRQKDLRDTLDEAICFFALIQKNYSQLAYNSSDIKIISAAITDLLDQLDAYKTVSVKTTFSLYRYLSALGNARFTKKLLKESVIFLISFLEDSFMKDSLSINRTYIDRAVRMLSQALKSSTIKKKLSLNEIEEVEKVILFLRDELNDSGKLELEKIRLDCVAFFNQIAFLFEQDSNSMLSDAVFLIKDFLKTESYKKLTVMLSHAEVIQKWLMKDEHPAIKYIDATITSLKEVYVSFSLL